MYPPNRSSEIGNVTNIQFGIILFQGLCLKRFVISCIFF